MPGQRKLNLANEPGEDVLLDVELLGDVADGGAVGDDGHEEDGHKDDQVELVQRNGVLHCRWHVGSRCLNVSVTPPISVRLMSSEDLTRDWEVEILALCLRDILSQ